jgi:hypothetical protein
MVDQNLVDVELYGVVFIYNPVNKSQLGLEQPATTVSAPPTAPTPTTPASSPPPAEPATPSPVPPAVIVPGGGGN